MTNKVGSRPVNAKRRGVVTAAGGRLVVKFPFSRSRFEAIRQLEHAAYDRQLRSWTLPLRSLIVLENTVGFRPQEIAYDFADEEAERRVAEVRARGEQAAERLLNSPLSLSEDDIALLPLDVVFRLSRRGTGLRAHVRKGDDAESAIAGVPGSHFIESERCWFFPVPALKEMLLALRDRRLRFAVEENASAALIQTAALRERLLRESESGTAAELRDSLLLPYIEVRRGAAPREQDIDGPARFSLRGYTALQLKEYLPGTESFYERRQIAAGFDEFTLAKVLYHSRRSGMRAWLSAEAAVALRAGRERCKRIFCAEAHFDDELLSVLSPEQCWAVDFDGRAGLLLARNAAAKGIQALGPEEGVPFLNGIFHSFSPPRLLSHFANSPGCGTPQSKGFVLQLEKLRNSARLRQRQRHFQSLGDCQPEALDPELAVKLFPHQRVAVSWLQEVPHALLGDDMGLGKTLSVLAAYASLCCRGDVDFLLVVCPSSLMRNWQREAEHWLSGHKLVVIPDTKIKRQRFLNKLAEMPAGWISGLILNYETVRLPGVYPLLSDICSRRKTFLCLDESQRTKNFQSKTYAALKVLAPVCRRRVLLSGTPTPKDLTDIWAQMHLLDGGARLGGNFYRWLGEVAELGNQYSEVAVKQFRPAKVQQTLDQVQEVLLRRTKEQVVKLPEKLFGVRDVLLKGDQKRRYDEIRKELVLRLTNASGETYWRQIDNIMEEFLRAVQAGSNPRLIDENWEGDPAKFIELDQIVEELVVEGNQKLIIWTNYRRNVEELVKRYGAHGAAAFTGAVAAEERQRLVESFQGDGDPRILIAIPAAGGVGITLTRAQTAVYLDKTWNAEHWLQSIDRIHRIGQTGTVNIISLHSCPVDEVIYANLKRKAAMQARLLGDGAERKTLPTRDELLAAVKP